MNVFFRTIKGNLDPLFSFLKWLKPGWLTGDIFPKIWWYFEYLLIFEYTSWKKEGTLLLIRLLLISCSSSWPIAFFLNLVTLGAWKIFTLSFTVLCQIFSVLKNLKLSFIIFFLRDKIQVSSWGCKISYKSVITLAQHKETVLNQGFMLKEYKWVVRRAWETLLLLLWEFGSMVWI